MEPAITASEAENSVNCIMARWKYSYRCKAETSTGLQEFQKIEVYATNSCKKF
jgi:hypothetical protein